jgi:lipopolysaccharide/colanic/teichoic acid biosynthesis glycosyltransferase
MGRQDVDYQERVNMDKFYIEYWSFWMDIVIIFQTFWKVLKREGAY